MIERSLVKPLYQVNKLEVPHNLLSIEERSRSWNNIRLAMKQQGLSCLIIAGVSIPGSCYARYVTNSGRWNSYVIFPDEGEVTEFASLRSVIEWMQKVSWAEDIRLEAWAHPKFAWAKVAAGRVKELGYEEDKIGLVGASGDFHSGWISYDNYVTLQNELPKATFCSATKLIDSIKLIKSDEEIKLTRKTAEFVDKAVEVMSEDTALGVKESDIYANMLGKILEEGSELPAVFLMSSGSDVKQAAYYPQHRILRKGDVILTELFSCYGGYHAHPQQPVAIGDVASEYEQFLEACLESIA